MSSGEMLLLILHAWCIKLFSILCLTMQDSLSSKSTASLSLDCPSSVVSWYRLKEFGFPGQLAELLPLLSILEVFQFRGCFPFQTAGFTAFKVHCVSTPRTKELLYKMISLLPILQLCGICIGYALDANASTSWWSFLLSRFTLFTPSRCVLERYF